MPIAKGFDVIQQAQSATGKTITFCIGILQRLDYGLQECQEIMLVPKHEMAQQIANVMRALGEFLQVRILHVLSFLLQGWSFS